VPVTDTVTNTVECADVNDPNTVLCSDQATVTKAPTPAICVKPTQMVLEYTGPSVAGATVTAGGVAVFGPADLDPGQQIAFTPSGGATFVIDIDPAPAGVSCIDTGNTVASDPEEILHISCSCKNTPATNMVVGNPVCLDSNSPDNTVSTCGGYKGAASPLWKLVSKLP